MKSLHGTVGYKAIMSPSFANRDRGKSIFRVVMIVASIEDAKPIRIRGRSLD